MSCYLVGKLGTKKYSWFPKGTDILWHFSPVHSVEMVWKRLYDITRYFFSPKKLYVVKSISVSWLSTCRGLSGSTPSPPLPSKFTCWNTTSHYEGLRSWGLWEIIRILWCNGSGVLVNEISILTRVIREFSFSLWSPPCEDTRIWPSSTWKGALTGLGPC